MKVALISTPWKKVPPDGYGGIESVIADIIKGVVELNLNINFSLFSVKETAFTDQMQFLKNKVKLDWFFEKEQYHEIGNEATKVWIEALHAMKAWASISPDTQLIHDHSGICFAMKADSRQRPPILITLHGPLDTPFIQAFYRFLSKTPGIFFTSISNAQRKSLPDIPYIRTVYNGVDIKEFPFREKKKNYLLTLGRITPVKGQKEAIEIAKAVDIPLVIAGFVENTPLAQRYWLEEIRPKIQLDLSEDENKVKTLQSLINTDNCPKIIYFGEANSTNKKWLYSRAKAFLMPISWEEPFGLVMIEAMASGTPVIALKRGAALEIVENGVTGFLCDNLEDMIFALRNLEKISSFKCRERVRKFFSHTKMAEEYFKLYTLLNQKAFC